MGKTIIELEDQDLMRIESILMDQDEKEALIFLKEVIKPKLRGKGSCCIDSTRSTGIKP